MAHSAVAQTTAPHRLDMNAPKLRGGLASSWYFGPLPERADVRQSTSAKGLRKGQRSDAQLSAFGGVGRMSVPMAGGSPSGDRERTADRRRQARGTYFTMDEASLVSDYRREDDLEELWLGSCPYGHPLYRLLASGSTKRITWFHGRLSNWGGAAGSFAVARPSSSAINSSAVS